MDSRASGSKVLRKQSHRFSPEITTNKASSPPPLRDDYHPQNDYECNIHKSLNTPLFTDDEDEMRRKPSVRHNAPTMAASTGFLADLDATAASAIKKLSSTINNASASTVITEHDEYARELAAEFAALPAEFPYKLCKEDKRESRATFTQRKEKMKNPSWKASLKELDELTKELKENHKQWNDPGVMMQIVMAKMKKEKKEKQKDEDWYSKMLADHLASSGPSKKLRRTIDGWEEVDVEDDEAEAMAERKQLRKRRISPYGTWKWNELSSSDEAEERERRVVAAAITILEKPIDSDDEDDEPTMHSLLSDDEAIAADPPLRTKKEIARGKAKKQDAELMQKQRTAREELRPLLHPFFRNNKSSADNILHAGALPVEVLKKSQFFQVPPAVRKQKAAFYKQKYEEKMAMKEKTNKVKRNRTAKKQGRFEARREKRSAYAHKLAAKGWHFPKEALTGYEDAIAKGRSIRLVTVESTRKAAARYKKAFLESDTTLLLAVEKSEPENVELEAPKKLLATLPLAPEYARDPAWIFPIWDDEMAWTEYDTLPGRFKTISKIIKDDDWNDQFVKGSKLDQELMRTIVVPVWKAMTYEEKLTVIGGQRADPTCFWSDDEDASQSYVSGSPKMVNPFDIEEMFRVPWSRSPESYAHSIKLDISASSTKKASFGEGEINNFALIEPTFCTDKTSFEEREKKVSDFLESDMSSSGTQKVSYDEVYIKEFGPLQSAKSSLSTRQPSFSEEETDKYASPECAKSSSSAEKVGFGGGGMHDSPAMVGLRATQENPFGGSNESSRSFSSPEKRSFEEEEKEANESDSWASVSFSSGIERAGFDQEETDGTPAVPETAMASEGFFEASLTAYNEIGMPRAETIESSLQEANLFDFEEPLDNSDPDLDLNMLFQRVGALARGEEASPFISASSREAELIFSLLRKEAVVRHWLPKCTFSYDNSAWKTRVPIFDPDNKAAANPAVFPPVVQEVQSIESSDPERIDLSLPNSNNVFQDRPDMQLNWIGIADDYRLGLNGHQRLTKPEWAKNYDLVRAQQPDPLIYMPKDTLEFDEVGYFSEVLPKPLVFPEVMPERKSYDSADWIWQKHCMDQRIGLHPRDQRPGPNTTISEEKISGLIGDNLPPEDENMYANGSIRYKRSSDASSDFLYSHDALLDANGSIRTKRLSDVVSFKVPDISDVPAEVGAQMLKELEEYRKPIPDTPSLGRPPPEKYIQPGDTPAAVLMKVYQEEYAEFRKECPEPTSIRFEREVFTEASISLEKKAKQELDEYLAKMKRIERLDLLKGVADAINELVDPGYHDACGPLEQQVELTQGVEQSVGLVRRKLDFKRNLKVDELGMKRAVEDIPSSGSDLAIQAPYTSIASAVPLAGQSGLAAISEALSRKSERYSLRDVDREKPGQKAPPSKCKAPSLLSVPRVSLNKALDASKARILQRMKDRGESAEKQASMATTLDSLKHLEPTAPGPETPLEIPIVASDEENKECSPPVKAPMTQAKARAIIDYLINCVSTMEEDEIKGNIVQFFGERFFAYALTELDLSPVDVSEDEAKAYLQQRFEAHSLIEQAEKVKAKKSKAKEISYVHPMSKCEAQCSFEKTMTPAKARALLEWAKRTQSSLYIKHMLAPGLLEYCDTELDAAPVAVRQEDGMKFIVWNIKMRESRQNLMELHLAARADHDRAGEYISEFGASSLISAVKGRALVKWLFTKKPDPEVMKLLQREDLDHNIYSEHDRPVQGTENEAIFSTNLLSKRVMEKSYEHRGQEAHRECADETSSRFEKETQKSSSEEGSMIFHRIDNPKDGPDFKRTFENDPEMSPTLFAQLIAWVLDVKPGCHPECVLGPHFMQYASQHQGPELEPLDDDEAFPIFKRYALAEQWRTGRIKVLGEASEQKADVQDDSVAIGCIAPSSPRSRFEESLPEEFHDIESPLKSGKNNDTVRLRLKPSQVCEFVEYLKSIHGHCDFKNKGFDRMIKAYIQLPDSTPAKDFPFRGEGLNLFKQMMIQQLIIRRKRQRVFDEGRVAYAYGAGTDPDIRRERGEEVGDEEEEEEAYDPDDDMYDGIAGLLGSVSSIPIFDSPRGSSGGSFESSLRHSSRDSFGRPSINEWPDWNFEVSGSVRRRSNKGLFIRKRLSHAFDPVPDSEASTERPHLHLHRHPSYHSQHDPDRNGERSSSPLMSTSPGGFGFAPSMPEREQSKNNPPNPTPTRSRAASLLLRASASERTQSSVPPSEDSENSWRPVLDGKSSRNFSSTETFRPRHKVEMSPPASFASWPSEDSYQNSTEWGTGSSASMAFSQFQALRRGNRPEEANMSASFSFYGPDSFGKDVEADNAVRDEEDDELSDIEAYEAWFNANHGITPEELEEGRRYLEERQMIDEMSDSPEMVQKVLTVLAKVDAKVAKAHAQAVAEAKVDEDKQTAFCGCVPGRVEDDSEHLLHHSLDPTKEFKKNLLEMIESEHLDAEEIEMLFEKIEERDAPAEYEWVDENGEPLEQSDWEDDSDDDSEIDQNYHVQEHQERMQLNYEQCEYEGALARVEAWRDAHEEHADPHFPQRERVADEARKAEDERMKAIVKAWEASRPPLTVPQMKRARICKAKASRKKKKKASLGNAQNSQGPVRSELESWAKKHAPSKLVGQTSPEQSRSDATTSRKTSFQVRVTVEDISENEQLASELEASLPRKKEETRLKRSKFSPNGERKDLNARIAPPTPSLRTVSSDAENEPLSGKKNFAAHIGLKLKDVDARASLPTSSHQSVSGGFSKMPAEKLTKTDKPAANVEPAHTPSRRTFSTAPLMASEEFALRAAPRGQRIAHGAGSREAPSSKKSIKARLGLKSKDLNIGPPSSTPSIRSVSHDLPRRTVNKLIKKQRPGANDARPCTPSREIFSPTSSMAASENAPRSVSLGHRVSSMLKRKVKEVNENERSGSSMIKRIKSLKLKELKDQENEDGQSVF